MDFAIGLLITVGCILGEPHESVIIAGSSLGIFIAANSTSVIAGRPIRAGFCRRSLTSS